MEKVTKNDIVVQSNYEPIALSTADAAKLIGVPVLTIRRLCNDGRLKYVEVGHGWYINRKELLRFFGEDV